MEKSFKKQINKAKVSPQVVWIHLRHSVYTSSTTKKATEKAGAAAAPKQKLKILCLHGYRQTSTTFYEKTGAFRKMVGKLCDLVLIDAPHLVPPEAHGLSASEVTEEQRGWWFSQPHGYFKVCMFTHI